MDHGRDAPDQRRNENGDASCDLPHQIVIKGTVGLFLLVDDRLRFTCCAASRTVTGVCRPPARGGRPDDPHAAARRPTAFSARRRRPATGGASRCPSVRRVPRCANASSPAIGEAIGLATEEIAAACVLLRRLAVAARGHGRPCLRAGGIGVPPVRWPSGSGRSGAGRSLCRTVRATRACAGGRCRRAQRVDARRTPSRRHPLQRHRSRGRDVRGRTSQHPPAVAHRAGARAGRGSGERGKAGAERCGSLTAGLGATSPWK